MARVLPDCHPCRDSAVTYVATHHRVELRGFEPLTFSLRTRRATNCATAPKCGSNDNTDRKGRRNGPSGPPPAPRAATSRRRPRARSPTPRTASLPSRRGWDLRAHSIAACDCASPACPVPGPTPPTCPGPSWPAAPSCRSPPTTPTARPSGRCLAGSARPASGPGAGWSSAPPRSPCSSSSAGCPRWSSRSSWPCSSRRCSSPLYSALTRIVPRGLAAGITVIGTLALVIGMLSFVGSQLTSQIDDMTSKVDRGHQPGPRLGPRDLRHHRLPGRRATSTAPASGSARATSPTRRRPPG